MMAAWKRISTRLCFREAPGNLGGFSQNLGDSPQNLGYSPQIFGGFSENLRKYLKIKDLYNGHSSFWGPWLCEGFFRAYFKNVPSKV